MTDKDNNVHSTRNDAHLKTYTDIIATSMLTRWTRFRYEHAEDNRDDNGECPYFKVWYCEAFLRNPIAHRFTTQHMVDLCVDLKHNEMTIVYCPYWSLPHERAPEGKYVGKITLLWKAVQWQPISAKNNNRSSSSSSSSHSSNHTESDATDTSTGNSEDDDMDLEEFLALFCSSDENDNDEEDYSDSDDNDGNSNSSSSTSSDDSEGEDEPEESNSTTTTASQYQRAVGCV